VAQLVEHHLAKVGVAGSNPVVRSRDVAGQTVQTVDLLRGSVDLASRRDPTAAVMRTSIGFSFLPEDFAREGAGRQDDPVPLTPPDSTSDRVQLPFFVNATAFKTAKNSTYER
jgi:hypothetical protein